MSKTQNLPIYLKLYQLTKVLYLATKNFKKEYKYTLGKEILDLAWHCLDLTAEANSLPNEKKKEKIVELSLAFDKLKIRLRMAQEVNLISERQFVHIHVNYFKETGEMAGGWLKWASKL